MFFCLLFICFYTKNKSSENNRLIDIQNFFYRINRNEKVGKLTQPGEHRVKNTKPKCLFEAAWDGVFSFHFCLRLLDSTWLIPVPFRIITRIHNCVSCVTLPTTHRHITTSRLPAFCTPSTRISFPRLEKVKKGQIQDLRYYCCSVNTEKSHAELCTW